MRPSCVINKGDVIIRENDIGESAYIIEKGRVKVTKEKDGKEICLGFMNAGDIFGEMSIVDDKPRSATVTAVEETALKEIHRDEFADILQNDHDVAITVLKVLFNRLRETNVKVMQLQAQQQGGVPETAQPEVVQEDSSEHMQLSLEGLTPRATKTLPSTPFGIDKLPFRIGRESPDPLSKNDLSLPDSEPFQISRHHIMIVKEHNRIGILDQGSSMGAEVNGQRLGGKHLFPGPIFFESNEGTLVLGGTDSLFRYKVVIK